MSCEAGSDKSAGGLETGSKDGIEMERKKMNSPAHFFSRRKCGKKVVLCQTPPCEPKKDKIRSA